MFWENLSKAVTWTGVGSEQTLDLFLIFKGYVVSVYHFQFLIGLSYQNWGISVEDAISFNIINKGSKILIEEFL